MPTLATNLNEDFSEVYQLYDWERFSLELLTGNSGDGLSPQQERCLRAIALDLPREQVAAKLNIKIDTVRDYLKKPYELIKMLFPNETQKGNMTEKKARYLILSKYKRSQLSDSTCVQKFDADSEAGKNENLEDIIPVNKYAWQTLTQVQPYIDKFYKLCEAEEFTEAFYTIFDTDDYENCAYNFFSSHGYLNIVISLYEQLVEYWIPRKGEKWEFLTALACLGDAHDRMGNHQIAIDHYHNCLKIALEIDDIDNIGGCFVNLGLAYYSLNNYEKALDYSRRGLEITREIGNKEFEANGWFNLALPLECLHQYSDALAAYEKACTLYQQMEMFEHVEHCKEAITQIAKLVDGVNDSSTSNTAAADFYSMLP